MRLPDHVPARSQSFSGHIPLRLEGFPSSVLAGLSIWRGVPNVEHATLCRAFGLDQCSFYFDLASSFRGVGSAQSGAGGSARGRARRTGLVFFSDQREPVGKISEVLESDRFWDFDPMNRSDFFNLERV